MRATASASRCPPSSPPPFVGDDRRWHDAYGDATADDVWAQVEAGAGTRLPFRALQHGDERCNRTTYGFYVGGRHHPILDDRDLADLGVRDVFLGRLGGVAFSGTPPLLLVARLFTGPWSGTRGDAVAVGWLLRTVRRVGIRRLLSHRVRPVTYMMHPFMEPPTSCRPGRPPGAARSVRTPGVAATQERLAACGYAMAHPDTGEIVPACVQHSVLDPAENAALRRLLPLTPVGRSRGVVDTCPARPAAPNRAAAPGRLDRAAGPGRRPVEPSYFDIIPGTR